jgi:hypothetical protein
LDLQLPMQSIPITTKVVSSKPQQLLKYIQAELWHDIIKYINEDAKIDECDFLIRQNLISISLRKAYSIYINKKLNLYVTSVASSLRWGQI